MSSQISDPASIVAALLQRDPDRWHAAWTVRGAHHAPTIRFDRPTQTLPVSLTGTRCALHCAHCNGHYLEHMRPIEAVGQEHARSLLISGGCDLLGRVPVADHLETVARLHSQYRLNWHVGLIDEDTMRRISPYVEMVSFDIVGDAVTAREVYGLDLTLDDYLRTLDMLRRYAPVVPHLTLGLRAGHVSGERLVLEALAQRDLAALVLIVLIPTAGTAYAACDPPPLSEVADLLLEARLSLPHTRLYLGCMRPHGHYRQALDELAVRAGLNAIVSPTQAAERVARGLGLEIVWGDECCTLS
jgi:lipoyl synthase